MPLPGIGHHKSTIFWDAPLLTFSPLLLKFSEKEPSDSTSNKSLFGVRSEFKKELPGTRTHSLPVFQMKTLSWEGIYITNALVGFLILCLSRQDMALVDFIMVNQVINCPC